MAKQITEEEFNKLDELHFKTENEHIKLIKSLQEKLKNNDWETIF